MEQFLEEIKEGIVLVDFWATWCGPCDVQSEILDRVKRDYTKLNFKIVKVNIEDQPQVASTFGIRSIPTIMIFYDGKLCETFVGVQQSSTLVDAIRFCPNSTKPKEEQKG